MIIGVKKGIVTVLAYNIIGKNNKVNNDNNMLCSLTRVQQNKSRFYIKYRDVLAPCFGDYMLILR